MRGKPGPAVRLAVVGMILVLAYSAGRVAILEGLPRLVDALGRGGTLMALAAIAVGLMVAGMVWMRRITSGEPDPGAWRSHDRSRVRIQEPIEAATMRPEVRQARETGRLMLAFALGVPFVGVFLWIATPGSMGDGLFTPEVAGIEIETLLYLAAAAGYLVGLGWMIRIYRARPEDGERTWRYRARR
jgi:hypothetical protein